MQVLTAALVVVGLAVMAAGTAWVAWSWISFRRRPAPPAGEGAASGYVFPEPGGYLILAGMAIAVVALIARPLV